MLAPPPTPEGWRPLLRECWIPPPLAFLKPAERSALSLFRFQKAQMNRFQDRDGIVTDKSKMYVPWHLDVSLNSKTCSVIFYVILFGSATSGKSWIREMRAPDLGSTRLFLVTSSGNSRRIRNGKGGTRQAPTIPPPPCLLSVVTVDIKFLNQV